jgi:hypothetical protein
VGAGYFGGRLMVALHDRIAIEMHAGYSPTIVAVQDPEASISVVDYKGAIVLSSIRLVGWLQPRPEQKHWAFHVTGGIGTLSRTGEAWKGIGGTSELALVAGGGLRLRVSDSLAFRFVIEDYLSRAHPRGAQLQVGRPRLHHDTVWTVGMLIPIGQP